MTGKIGINGFGRIGRLAFRRIMDLGEKSKDIEVVAINDLTTPALLAHLLKYDSTHGTFDHEVSSTEDSIVVDGKKYRVYAEPQAQNIPWVKNDGVDFVLECTGFYTSKAKSQAHLDAGVKRVLISAPAGNDLKTIVYSVNQDTLTADDKIVSAGSCTCLLYTSKMKLKKNNQYLVRLNQQVQEILENLQIWDTEKGLVTRIPKRIMSSREGAMSYLRGAFLAGGSVNNPETSRYHLEIYSTYEDHNEDLAKLMNEYFYLNAKMTKRRRGYIVYLKEAEKIGDFLHIVGALNAMLNFEDLRIMRDMRNSVNRLVNCDTANMKKTASASAKQVEDIQLIQKEKGLDDLSEKLQILANFRLAHPELTLKEVADQIPDGPISKSGVNHRFKKLHEIAESLRE